VSVIKFTKIVANQTMHGRTKIFIDSCTKDPNFFGLPVAVNTTSDIFYNKGRVTAISHIHTIFNIEVIIGLLHICSIFF
jgi:hypothetical protein